MNLIQPVMTGSDLLQSINSTTPAPGQVAIWWLGQSGYAVKTASTLVYLDLYLSEHLTTKYAQTEKPHIRMTAAPLRGHEITNARLVFASHKHSDHLDPGTLPDLFTASPDARLVLPLALVDHAVALGLPRDRLIPTRGDESFTIDGVQLHAFPSAHPGLDYDETTGYPFLGYGLEIDGIRLYHSGDTVIYPGLAERLLAFQPDIVFLPVNGTDARRAQLQTPPNMHMPEAVTLAYTVGAKLLIPHHYDLFTFNTADITLLPPLAEAAGQPYRVLQCGERFIWQK